MCLLYFVHGRLLNQNKICRILRLSGSLKYQSQHGLRKTGAKGKFRSPDFQRLKKWFKKASSQRHQLKLFQDRKHLPTLLFSVSLRPYVWFLQVKKGTQPENLKSNYFIRWRVCEEHKTKNQHSLITQITATVSRQLDTDTEMLLKSRWWVKHSSVNKWKFYQVFKVLQTYVCTMNIMYHHMSY